MTTRIMARLMLFIGLIGAVLTATTGLVVGDLADVESLRSHLLMGLGSVLLVTLGHGWIAMFLASSRIAMERTLVEADGARVSALAEALARAQWIRRWVIPLCILAVLLTSASFLAGSRLFAGETGGGLHGGSFMAALAVQVLALLVALRGLERYHALLARFEVLGAPKPELATPEP